MHNRGRHSPFWFLTKRQGEQGLVGDQVNQIALDLQIVWYAERDRLELGGHMKALVKQGWLLFVEQRMIEEREPGKPVLHLYRDVLRADRRFREHRQVQAHPGRRLESVKEPKGR